MGTTLVSSLVSTTRSFKLKNLLFIPAPIASHFLPTFSLAKNLAAFGYNIYYLVESENDKLLVVSNGFKPISIKTKRVGIGGDITYYAEKHNVRKDKIGWRSVLKSYLSLEMFHDRRNELLEIVNDIMPTSVLIDIFSSADYMVLYSISKTIRLSFFSPMLCTSYLVPAPIDESGGFVAQLRKKLNYYSILDKIIWKLTIVQRWIIFAETDIPWKNRIDVTNSWAMLLRNIPQVILGPSELDSERCANVNHLYHTGLNIDLNRRFNKHTEIEVLISTIEDRKQAGCSILYCSFGTFYGINDYMRITSFLIALSEAVENLGVFVAVSVSQDLLKTAREYLVDTDSISYFSNLPQIDILPLADLFICHGGLGSIKESIFFEVPMLIYPLDYSWDQYSNGLRVLESDLGLMGNLDKDEIDQIKTKISMILTDGRYKDALRQLGTSINKKYSSGYYEFLSKVI